MGEPPEELHSLDSFLADACRNAFWPLLRPNRGRKDHIQGPLMLAAMFMWSFGALPNLAGFHTSERITALTK